MSDVIKTSPTAPTTDERLTAVEKRLAAIERRTNDAARAVSEAVWVQVFHDTIRGSAWLKNKTFDFISIDGPLSGDMKELGRVDVQKLIPDGLATSFAILYDDTQRPVDKRSLDMLVAKLKAAGLDPQVGRSFGAKDCHIVVSPDNAYLRSM